jgi:uncharacterized membrane protein YhaH (DUF805 family)
VGPVEAIATCLRKFATFSGRADRREYWWFLAAMVAASVALSGLDRLTLADPMQRTEIEAAFSLLIFVPLIAAGFRRFQDTGRPGRLMLIAVAVSAAAKLLTEGGLLSLPLFAAPALPTAVFVLVLAAAAVVNLLTIAGLAMPSQPGPNRYGPNPNEVTP